MIVMPLQSDAILRDRMSGWLVSLATHTAVAGMAIILMSDLHLAEQPEPFRWQVSVTQPPIPQSAQVPSPPTPIRAPTPKVTKVPTPVQKIPTPTNTRTEQVRHVTQAVQSVTPLTRQEIRHVEPMVHSKQSSVQPTEPQPTVVRESEPLNATAETRYVATREAATPAKESVATRSERPVVESSSVIAQEVVERADSTATEQVAVSEKAVTRVTEMSDTSSSPVEMAALQTKPLAESTLSQPTVESALVETSPLHRMPVIESSAVQPLPTAPIQQASIQNAPVHSMPTAKPDYGWLLDTLWKRVEKLKRYPHIARTNRWEGLVVLQAVIDNHGQLLDLKVAESSGYAVLDQDAMDVMRKSCPLHLEHSLGKPQVELRVPISYKLR